jgi:hypothetical protein
MAWLDGVDRVASAAGPYDAWLQPRAEMIFRPTSHPIRTPVAKLGGQPAWLAEPYWPVSAATGEPMTFVGQFPLPGPDRRMSYLFLTQDAESIAETYEAEAGENALLIQPGGRVPSFVAGHPERTGPALWRRGAEWEHRIPVEMYVDVVPPHAGIEAAFERDYAFQRAERQGDNIPLDDVYSVEICRSYVGGPPLMWQPSTTHLGEGWRFFFQLDGGEGWHDDAYALNFGGGTGYAFLSDDELEGRFYWDCV